MIDRSGYARLTAEHPTLYHVLYRSDDEASRSVRENGLIAGTSRRLWHGLWEPRPGHVYLATADYVKTARGWGDAGNPCDLFAVDTARLFPSLINPDEDHFRTDDYIAGPDRMFGARHVCQAFRLEFPPTPWLWDWASYLKMRPLPSYGEWADAVDLGRDAAQTRYSIRMGSVAYKGVVPPMALTLVGSTRTPGE